MALSKNRLLIENKPCLDSLDSVGEDSRISQNTFARCSSLSYELLHVPVRANYAGILAFACTLCRYPCFCMYTMPLSLLLRVHYAAILAFACTLCRYVRYSRCLLPVHYVVCVASS